MRRSGTWSQGECVARTDIHQKDSPGLRAALASRSQGQWRLAVEVRQSHRGTTDAEPRCSDRSGAQAEMSARTRDPGPRRAAPEATNLVGNVRRQTRKR